MYIIPAIDLIEGKCVRLTQGDYEQKKVYDTSPLDMAKYYADLGITHVHIVDLDGAKAKQVRHLHILESIAMHTPLIIDFGGGVNDISTAQSILSAGACFITIGSVAIQSPDVLMEWSTVIPPNKWMIAADVKNERLVTHAWQQQTTQSVFDMIAYFESRGFRYFFCTDIAKDGLLMGPSIHLYKKIRSQFPCICLIASGGISVKKDIEDLSLIPIDGVIIGKAIYENRIDISQLTLYY